MKITTESGSVYKIDDNICRKYDRNGTCIDSFKVYAMKAVPDSVTTLMEIYELPDSEPQIGLRMYISGKDSWWISTRVISYERKAAKDFK